MYCERVLSLYSPMSRHCLKVQCVVQSKLFHFSDKSRSYQVIDERLDEAVHLDSSYLYET